MTEAWIDVNACLRLRTAGMALGSVHARPYDLSKERHSLEQAAIPTPFKGYENKC